MIAPAYPSDDIEVVHLERPVGRDAVEVGVGEPGSAVHLPKDRGAVDVAPDDVGLAVAVEVTDPLDLPVGRDGAEVEIRDLRAAIHLPKHRLTVARAPPQDVGAKIAVEVAGALD